MNNTNFADHSLNFNQRRILSIYTNQYYQIQSQIEHLYRVSDEIRDNINNIIFNDGYRTTQNSSTSRPTSRNVRNTRNRNFRSFSENNNTSPFIYYDYNNPVLPSIFRTETINTERPRNTYLTSLYRERDTDYRNYLSSFFTNVDIFPTQQQIEYSTRNVRYGNIENPTNETCPITLERFQPDDIVTQIHYCGHLFNPEELSVWFQTNVRCPMCRYDIRNYVSSSRTSQPIEEDMASDLQNDSPRVRQHVPVPTENNTGSDPLDIPIPNTETNNNNNIGTSTNTELITAISEQLLGLLNNNFRLSNNNERFVYDPSNNIFMYETIITNNDRR